MHQTLAILALVLTVTLPPVLRGRLKPAVIDAPAARALHVLFLVTLALMALSSIVMLAVGSTMHGWMLLLHMSVAPLFCITIALLALFWVERNSALLRLVLLAGLVTILTAMLSMMSWFGSEWQTWLLNVHRAGSMILLVAAVVQAGGMFTRPSAGGTVVSSPTRDG